MDFPSRTLVIVLAALAGCNNSTSNEESRVQPPPEAAKVAPTAQESPVKAAAAPLPPSPPAISDYPKFDGSHQGQHRWSHALGGKTTDAGRAVAVSKSGAVAVAGYFSSNAKLGAEAFEASPSSDPKNANEVDGYLACYDAAGKPLWTRKLGGPGAQMVSSVAYDGQGNIIVGGWFGHEIAVGDGTLTSAGGDDAFVIKFSPDGRRLWAKRYGGENIDGADDIAIDAGGNIYVTGVFRATADFAGHELKSNGLADIFLLKLNPAGETTFIKSYGTRYDDFGRSVSVDSQGHVLLFGEFSDSLSFGGAEIEHVGNRDLFMTKLSPSGDHIWSRGMGTDLDELGLSITVDPADAVIITGSFEDKMSFGGEELASRGRGDIFIAKYDSKGEHLWSKHFGGKDEDIGFSVASDPFGNLFLAGMFWVSVDFGGGQLASAGKKDMFIAKFAPSGKHLWSKRYGGKESESARAVATTAQGDLLVSGVFRHELDLGGEILPYAHEEDGLIPYADVFLAQFGP